MPPRLRDLKRALELQAGFRVEEPRSGSHWKVRGPGGKSYPIPAHNGLKTEISEVYVRGLCRTFGLDEAEFRKLL
jgi:hypothetical protein